MNTIPANAYPQWMREKAMEMAPDHSNASIARHLGIGETTVSVWLKDVNRYKKAPLGEDKINQLLRAWR